MSRLPSCPASSWLFPSFLWSLKSYCLFIAPEKCSPFSFYFFFSHTAPSTLNALFPLYLANSFWSDRTQLRQTHLQEVFPDSPPHPSSSPPAPATPSGSVQVEPPVYTSTIADFLVGFSHWVVRSFRESTVAHSPLYFHPFIWLLAWKKPSKWLLNYRSIQ